MTADLDLVVDLQQAPLRRTLSALAELGMRPRIPLDPMDFPDAGVRRGWREDKGLTVFSMYHPDDPLLEVDLFSEEPIPREQLLARATLTEVGGVLVRVASVEDLVTMKRAVGRPQDLADIAALLGQDDP